MSNVAQALQAAALETPDKPALVLQQGREADLPVSFLALFERASAWATALAEAGVRPGEVVILILPHGMNLVTAFFGAVLRGAVPSIMPFLTEKLAPEPYRAALANLFAISAPAAVITSPIYRPDVELARAGSTVREVLLAGEGAPANQDALSGPGQPPDRLVLLQHSSGTTGLQKGVALSHQAVFNQVESYARALALRSDDVVVSWLPLYHDMGLIAGFLLPLLTRTPLVLMSPFDWVHAPQRLLHAVTRYRGTLTWLPNFAYNFCAQKIRPRDLEGVDLSSWRAVINCSEPMHWKSHQMFLDRFVPYGLNPTSLATCYAMAENVFAVTQGGIERPVTVDHVLISAHAAQPVPPGTPGSVAMLSAGRPIDGTFVQVVDAHGQALPERRLGEIALRSNCLLSGYYHSPDLTKQAFQNGWYLTGDLGYLAGGELYVTGRKKDLIIVGGKNIYPQDLERLASEVDGIHPGRTVAFGIYNEEMGTEDVGLVAESDQPAGQFDALAEQVRRRVNQGSDIVLRYVKIVEHGWLLKTSSGKIARAANRDKFLKG